MCFCLIFLGRGGEKEKNIDVKRNIDEWPPVVGTRTLGMCPGRELNLWPFGEWDDTPTRSHTGQGTHFLLPHFTDLRD